MNFLIPREPRDNRTRTSATVPFVPAGFPPIPLDPRRQPGPVRQCSRERCMYCSMSDGWRSAVRGHSTGVSTVDCQCVRRAHRLTANTLGLHECSCSSLGSSLAVLVLVSSVTVSPLDSVIDLFTVYSQVSFRFRRRFSEFVFLRQTGDAPRVFCEDAGFEI